MDSEVGVGEVRPTFRVRIPTKGGIPFESSDLKQGTSDFLLQLEHTIWIVFTRLHYLATKEKGWNSNKAFQAAEKGGFCARE